MIGLGGDKSSDYMIVYDKDGKIVYMYGSVPNDILEGKGRWEPLSDTISRWISNEKAKQENTSENSR